MPDICYTDASRVDVGVLRGASLNTVWGDSGNDFELTVDIASPERIEDGALVYVEGTEYGGVVDEREASSSDGTIRYRGRSWHGMLRDRVLCPDAGADYLTVSGEANAVLLSLVSRMGLSDVMTVSSVASGIEVKHQFERFCDAYSGIRAMLSASGARLAVAYDSVASRAVLSAVPVVDWSDGPTSDQAGVDVTRVSRPYNHLVCLGSGELRDRVVQHWYADEAGKVSGKQSLFGVDERATTYDYSNAGADELSVKGPKKLSEYQQADSMDATLDVDGAYAVGDVVPGTDVGTGTEVSVVVGTVDATVDELGVTVTYRAGGTAQSGASSGSSESSGSGGAAYAAGEGISIVGRIISAEVTQAKLDALAKVAESASNTAAGASNAVAREAEARESADSALGGLIDAEVDARRGAVSKVSEAVAARVASVTGSGAVTASTGADMAVTVSHAASGVSAGAYGPTADSTPGFGSKVTVGARLSIDARGHVTSAHGRSVTIPSAVATQTSAGLMSAADKKKLDGIQAGAGSYTHPTHTAHASGLYKVAVDSLGHVSSATKVTKSDITALGIPAQDTNTTYGEATANAAGLMSAADKKALDAAPSTYQPAGDYAASSHTHAASDVSSGVLPVARGGTGNAAGNAATATRLRNARTVTLTGAVTGSASFDGSEDVTITCEGQGAAAGFLAAHPVGSVFETTSAVSPAGAYGGTWERVPSLGAFKWERKA